MGSWALAAVVVGGIYPAFVRRFQVVPAESSREAEYISRNIAARTQETPTGGYAA